MATGTTRPGLSGDDLTALADALAQGARATVYLRDPVPSLGLPAGTSARVVSISGTTVLVRPRGVNDELPFETDELQMTRRGASSRARKAPAQAKPKRPAATRRKNPTTVTVTLHADLAGAWTVAVQQGDRASGKPVPVSADAVERAVTELGEPGAARAVQTALEVAREVAAARVVDLTRQLEEARDTLAALGAV